MGVDLKTFHTPVPKSRNKGDFTFHFPSPLDLTCDRSVPMLSVPS